MYDLKIISKLFNLFFLTALLYGLFMLSSCSVSKRINKQARLILLQDSVINTGHIGISIYEPATNSYWYNYNAEKYFVPASNTKLFTLYAGMKYLGDSLVGLRYDDKFNIRSAGDPTFLHPDFIKQPAFEFLKHQKDIFLDPGLHGGGFRDGWTFDDYMEPFTPCANSFPVYANLITVKWIAKDSVEVLPKCFDRLSTKLGTFNEGFDVFKDIYNNRLVISNGNTKTQKLPFSPFSNYITDLLLDTLPDLKITITSNYTYLKNADFKILHSQPSDSLFTPMMHNSDNFFAEQTLLMASNEHLGYMNDEAIIDTLLKTNLKDVPQKPKWVDGCGLSRYNLFTPQSFVYILNKMKNEFGLERLKTILPTGGEGTLKNYYITDSSFIYAKTGSMSNQVTFSGFLITKKNKLLVFSLLANNVMGSGTAVRRAYEHFLKQIREKY